jgi:UTP--glucose-1-phosphate uridylyltransferase
MTSRKPIRKAVFPVAGLGTRFLPATKAIPKELLPIVDRPLIQYAVEEAREAGIEQMIFVTGRGKTALVEHFDIAYELEATMSERGKNLSVLDPTRFTPGDLIAVRQQVPLGSGHAIWCARAIVGDEPFAILLPDELMVGEAGLHGADGRGLQRGRRQPDLGARGAARGSLELRGHRPGRIARRADRSARTGREAAGRGSPVEQDHLGPLHPPARRSCARSRSRERGAGGEIQLTDAMAQMIGRQPFHCGHLRGARFDCGSKTGFVEATLRSRFEREDMGAEVRRIAERLLAR